MGKVILNEVQKLNKPGAFSDIFCMNDKIIKLFISNNHHKAEDQGISDELRRSVFKTQLLAYQIANKDNELKKVIPVFYGTLNIEGVTSQDGKDISDQYLPDCNYCLEYLKGIEKDLKYIHTIKPELKDEIESIKVKFNSADIKYLTDASVFIIQNEIKFIDFATEYIPIIIE